jgi:dipeptidyl-peptidase-4
MPVFDRFTAARKELVPPGYLIPARFGELVTLLREQGIGVDAITAGEPAPVESFTIDSLLVDSLFEGHRAVRVEGHWKPQAADTLTVPGWYLVKTDQPLGTFAAYLLEPASEDGVVTWNFLDRELEIGGIYPIHRLRGSWRVPRLGVP